MNRRRVGLLVSATAIAVAGLGAGIAVAATGGSTPRGVAASDSASGPSYSWYRSMMGGFSDGSMMGGRSSSWMFGRSGYGWMMGGVAAPGWMRGGSLPSWMIGPNENPGGVMGRLFADAPGPRLTSAQAIKLGDEIPTGARVDRVHDRITFSTMTVRLAVLASPSMPREFFRIAKMTNPTVVVPAGAHVRIELVNADADMAHGLVVAERWSSSTFMPMMSATEAFPRSALWFLGESSLGRMHAGTMTFTAGGPGTYQYLCPVPGHARKGMVGTLIVTTH